MKLSDIHIRDPYIFTEDGKYYMYGTRGSECWGIATGLDLFVSCDLEEWTEYKDVFKKPEGFWADRHFWAPEVHKYDGRYYMFVSFKNETECRGTQILKANSPFGPFELHSDGPVTPRDWECLDGTLWVEDGTPYMIFCHEWAQIVDGEMCALQLSKDLKTAVGMPKKLFNATALKSVKAVRSNNGWDGYVTDGPFIYKAENSRLVMIWSTSAQDGYCEALAYSDSGKIMGEWTVDERLLFEKDGGHGMIFKDFEGKTRFVAHAPNKTPFERPKMWELYEKDNTLYLK